MKKFVLASIVGLVLTAAANATGYYQQQVVVQQVHVQPVVVQKVQVQRIVQVQEVQVQKIVQQKVIVQKQRGYGGGLLQRLASRYFGR